MVLVYKVSNDDIFWDRGLVVVVPVVFLVTFSSPLVTRIPHTARICIKV